jgi:hypothetical protein
MLSRTKSRVWVTLLTVGLTGLCANDASVFARADDAPAAGVNSEVLVLLASEKPGVIDPSLSRLRALKHAPFNVFKSVRILSRSAVRLVEDDWAEVNLPNGRKVHLNLVQRLPDGRIKVQVSINRPNQKDYLPWLQVIASPGEPFFVAGQKFQGGTLVIGVRVGEHVRALP